MSNGKSRFLFITQFMALFFFFTRLPLYGQLYPLIEQLQPRDPVFRQLTEDIARYYRATAGSQESPELALYRYTVQDETTLIALAARFNLPYETIAILNGINRFDELKTGAELLIPNTPGIFVPVTPASDIEKLILSWRIQNNEPLAVTVRNPGPEQFYFFPGERFNSVERAYFFGILFRFPLPGGIISSPFGPRHNPFTRQETFHHGIDIAAPENSEVYAAGNGRVIKTGYDSVLGNYIVLEHPGGYETLYAHLKNIFAELHQEVRSGMIIGAVGSTGLSTGPHLHFEVRRDGRARDPLPLIPIQ